MKVKSYVRNLYRWVCLIGDLSSFWYVAKIRGSGWEGGEYNVKNAVPVRVNGLEFPMYLRPGTYDYITFREMFVSRENGEYSSFIEEVKGPVNYILDVGTNSGYSIGFFLREWPAARVTGVEPFEPNVRLAQKSLANLIEKGQVRLHHCFAGSSSGEAPLVSGESGGSNTFRKGDQTSNDRGEVVESCPVRSISDILAADRPEGSIDVMKCDVEGGEREIFDSCAPWISRVRYIVIELHGGLDESWLRDKISRNGATLNVRGSREGHGDAKLVWGKIN